MAPVNATARARAGAVSGLGNEQLRQEDQDAGTGEGRENDGQTLGSDGRGEEHEIHEHGFGNRVGVAPESGKVSTPAISRNP